MGRALPALQAWRDGGRVTARKQTERRVAAELAGVHVPVSARARGDAPDIPHNRLSLEVKHRAALPAWLTGVLEQARASSRDGGHPRCRPARLRDALRGRGVSGALVDPWALLAPQDASEREAGNDADRYTTAAGEVGSEQMRTQKGDG